MLTATTCLVGFVFQDWIISLNLSCNIENYLSSRKFLGNVLPTSCFNFCVFRIIISLDLMCYTTLISLYLRFHNIKIILCQIQYFLFCYLSPYLEISNKKLRIDKFFPMNSVVMRAQIQDTEKYEKLNVLNYKRWK